MLLTKSTPIAKFGYRLLSLWDRELERRESESQIYLSLYICVCVCLLVHNKYGNDEWCGCADHSSDHLIMLVWLYSHLHFYLWTSIKQEKEKKKRFFLHGGLIIRLTPTKVADCHCNIFSVCICKFTGSNCLLQYILSTCTLICFFILES